MSCEFFVLEINIRYSTLLGIALPRADRPHGRRVPHHPRSADVGEFGKYAGRTTKKGGQNTPPSHIAYTSIYSAHLECDALTCAFTKRMRVGGNGATF